MGYKRRNVRRSKTTTIKKVVENVLKQRTEVKHDGIRISVNMTSVPAALNLVDYIRQGDKATEREGNRINLLSCAFRGKCIQGDTPYNHCRLAVVETREPLPLLTASTYDAATLFTDLAFCGPNSMWNFNVVKRVFWDKNVVLRQLVDTQMDARLMNKHLTFGKNGKTIFYDGQTSTTLGEATRTYLYIVYLSDSVLPLSHPGYEACLYLRYIDQ